MFEFIILNRTGELKVRKHLNAKYITRPEGWKKLIDRLAYGSLVLDICIAIITTGSLMYPDALKYLFPVNMVLTIVVVLTVVSVLMVLLIKFYNKSVEKVLKKKNKKFNQVF